MSGACHKHLPEHHASETGVSFRAVVSRAYLQKQNSGLSCQVSAVPYRAILIWPYRECGLDAAVSQGDRLTCSISQSPVLQPTARPRTRKKDYSGCVNTPESIKEKGAPRISYDILHADMQLSSRCDDCWSSHILSVMDGLTQSSLFKERLLSTLQAEV